MAFDKTDLALMAHGGDISMWSYKSNDTAAVIDSAQYFNDAVAILNVGDFIFANADVDGTPAYGVFVVLSNDGTDVDVGDLVALNSADTD